MQIELPITLTKDTNTKLKILNMKWHELQIDLPINFFKRYEYGNICYQTNKSSRT
jgi:hypothetical protein